MFNFVVQTLVAIGTTGVLFLAILAIGKIWSWFEQVDSCLEYITTDIFDELDEKHAKIYGLERKVSDLETDIILLKRNKGPKK